jgi:hypothetical protein
MRIRILAILASCMLTTACLAHDGGARYHGHGPGQGYGRAAYDLRDDCRRGDRRACIALGRAIERRDDGREDWRREEWRREEWRREAQRRERWDHYRRYHRD